MPPSLAHRHELRRLTRWVWGTGAALVLGQLLVLASLGWLERRGALEEAQDRAALLARVLEDHATRSVDGVGIALTALAGIVAGAGEDHVGSRGAGRLTQALTGLPLVRSAALVDRDGLVLSSTQPGEIGLTLDLAALGALPAIDRTALGPLQPGRGLAVLQRLRPAPPGPAGLHFIPLVRSFRTADGQPLLLVALLNPDLLGSYQASALRDEAAGARALLARYDGQLLAAAGPSTVLPGQTLGSHIVWQQKLTEREHGALVGPGEDGAPAVLAFRASRSEPLVAVVELPLAAVEARWWQAMRWPLLFAGLGVLLVLALVLMAHRGLRARAVARRMIDAARDRVVHSERELSVLVRSVQSVLFRTDAHGALSFVNLRWSALSGEAADQALGQRLQDLVAPADVARVAALFDARCDDGARRAQSVAMQVGSEPRWFDVAVVPLRQGEQVIGFAGSAADVTDRWRAERATREARDSAEAASRAKSEFIANISHELRTPLQSIIGFSELGRLRGREQRLLAEMFGDIQTAGQRMLALVNDLLDVAKIESTVGSFRLELTDLRDTARAVAQELQPLLQARRLALDLQPGPLPLQALVDPLRLHQALRNVLANAIKFSPPGGCITCLGRRGPDGRLAFEVRDQGPGVPAGELEAILEAFVQSSRTKDGAGGTGLGLAICRKILRAHGGDIQADNAPGGGAVFTLWLPAQPSDAEAQAEARPEAQPAAELSTSGIA